MENNFLINFDNYKRAWSINTELSIGFNIKYSSDIFNLNNHELSLVGGSTRKIIVIDENVYQLYEIEFLRYLKMLKVNYEISVVKVDEELKNLMTADFILNFFEEKRVLRRSEPVIAIGGGVLLDLVGFCCSIYRRGVPYVKIPTTLLAMVDASVGAKVGINHMGRRNRLGSYYPATLTLLDKKFIKTQSRREITNGLAEIFKLAIIKSSELFKLLESNFELFLKDKLQHGAVPVRLINLAISEMVSELGPNLWEKKLDRCVDFGHSFSPVVEMKNLPELLHGEAVALDCLFSSCISCVRNYIDKVTLNRIFKLAANLELPVFHQDFCKKEILLNGLEDTMKHRNDNQYLPLPIDIGNYVIINDLRVNEIEVAISLFKEMNNVD